MTVPSPILCMRSVVNIYCFGIEQYVHFADVQATAKIRPAAAAGSSVEEARDGQNIPNILLPLA